MKAMLAVLLVSLLSITLVLIATSWLASLRTPARFTIMHANRKPCPPGYRFVKDMFTERDGSHEDACIAETFTGEGDSIDLLKAGESVQMHITIPPEVLRELERWHNEGQRRKI